MKRREFSVAAAAAFAGSFLRWPPPAQVQGARPRPSPAQLAWQRDELALFLHFGVNTFTDREWGDGREDPAIFNPASLDARQWARAARAAGAHALILTAKHHDGFCLWPSRLTAHSVARSPWRGGGGDVVRRLQPQAVMFSDAGPDIRWCGNESGVAGDPNWSTMHPAAVPYPGAPGDAVIAALQHGDPQGSVWRPAEVDVSIRPGWFHHAAEDEHVKTVDQLTDIWFTSVGRNSKLLLNVPPTREGLLHATEVARLTALRARLTALFVEDFAFGRRVLWSPTGPRTGIAPVDLGRTVKAGIVGLEEDIVQGQRVGGNALHGAV